MTESELEAIAARAEAATEGPYRTDVPALVAEVRRLRAGLADIRDTAHSNRRDTSCLASNPPQNSLARQLWVLARVALGELEPLK